MNKFWILVSTLFLIASFQNLGAQGKVSKEERRGLADAFNRQFQNKWQIRWDDATGTPSSILGHKTAIYEGTAIEKASFFLKGHKGMFGIDDFDTDLYLGGTKQSEMGGTRILFQQRYKGIPVLSSGYLLAVSKDGSIYYVSGDYYPDVAVDTKPSLSASRMRSIIYNDLRGTTVESISEPVLYVSVRAEADSESYSLVYVADAAVSLPPGLWRYTIDAHLGAIISRVNLIRTVNGNGNVYLNNPLHGTPVNQTVHRLNDVSPRMLNGNNVVVYNAVTDEASSPTATFVYTPGTTHFDEVMAYYHSDEFESWLISKGMANEQVSKVTIQTHYHSGYYAYSIPSYRQIYYDDAGPGLNNPTFESAVLAHEYAHVVTETYNSLTQNVQAEAMDEAYSDYLSLAYENQSISTSVIGEYIDQAGGYNYTRSLVNTWNMSSFNTIDLEPNGIVEEHDRSVIFSGSLWDFRRDPDVASPVADELVLESLNNLDANPSFLDGKDALKAAAYASGYSQYVDDILNAFGNHGLGMSVSVSGPYQLELNHCGNYSASAGGGSGAYSYSWYRNGTYQGSGNPKVICANTRPLITVRVTASDNNTGESRSAEMETDVWCEGCPQSIDQLQDSSRFIATIVELPKEYMLGQNFPNPFNPTTNISFALPRDTYIKLIVYDMLGREVARLVDGQMGAGYHTVTWDASKVASGIYIYRFSTDNFVQTRRMVVMK